MTPAEQQSLEKRVGDLERAHNELAVYVASIAHAVGVSGIIACQPSLFQTLPRSIPGPPEDANPESQMESVIEFMEKRK